MKLSKEDFWALAVVSPIMAALVVVIIPDRPSHLVGYGCQGSNGQVLIGKEEDDFPPCSKIERVYE